MPVSGRPSSSCALRVAAAVSSVYWSESLHVQILGRLLHALSHGGNIAVSIPQNNGHFQQGWLVMLITGSEGQQPEQHTQSNQGKHQLQ